ncbi:MAG: Stk1 family PASTA domain-containing Ser/Thr kinase [Desulfotomaculum sp.]|nr:Stk1 family PASTA domain-containing Ser/Thr kinase [Desulfotomaculum sp.]
MMGKLLGNRYEILEKLGGGGMSVVYKAKDKFLNRLVTVKVLRHEFVSDNDFIRRFRREAQAVASLSHPNIVNIHDVGQEDDTHYLVMEYIDGDNLKNFMRSNPDLPIEKVINIIRQVCDALQHAHENNIVHRDVKPQNILITRDQRVKLTDFGIALEASTGTISNTQTVMGSVHYISPEQAKGITPGPQSDIYSLGVVLYEMLTGELPFKGEGPVAVALKHIQEQPELPSKINPALSKDLERVVMKAMSKEPQNRYQSAKQFNYDLQQVMGMNIKDADEDYATQVLPGSFQPDDDIEDQEDESKPQKSKKALRLVILASLLLLSLLSGAALALFNFLNVPEVEVPDVQGLVAEDARVVLNNVGLKSEMEKVYNNEVEEGRVIAQDPEPDKKVKQGRTVKLKVSLGPELNTLPDVRNQTLSDAKIILHNAGFNKYKHEEKFSEEVEAGIVIGQEPLPGEYPKGTNVKLIVSKGPEKKPVPMPKLIGLYFEGEGEKAKELLAKFNLIPESIEYQQSSSYLPGQVISQNPPAGTDINKGTGVSLVISEGPGPPIRGAEVRADIPSDGKEHQLKIFVHDIRGLEDPVYISTHSPGEVVVKTINYYGTAVIEVYIDDQLVRKRELF